MPVKITLRTLRGLSLMLVAALLTSCSTHKPAPNKFTFFPPSPDEPRIQFLTSFSSDWDLGRSSSFLDYVTGRPAGVNPLIKPYGIAARPGQLYVCDTMAGAVEVFDIAKKRARYIKPRGEGHLQVPINIAFDTDGSFYVADSGRNQVLIFAKDETYLAAVGTEDEMRPTDVAVTADRFYVADVKGHTVRVYSKAERKLLFTIPADPKAQEGRLFSPTNLAIDPEGRLLVCDTGAFSVQVYDLDGKYLRRIGQQGAAAGLFARPKGISVDRQGRLYVVDAATQVVQVFDKDGKLLIYFGKPGDSTQGELYLPAGVKVDYDNNKFFQNLVAPGFQLDHVVLVTSQFGDNKITVYGFIHKK